MRMSKARIEREIRLINWNLEDHGEVWRDLQNEPDLQDELIKRGYQIQFVFRGIWERAHYRILSPEK